MRIIEDTVERVKRSGSKTESDQVLDQLKERWIEAAMDLVSKGTPAGAPPSAQPALDLSRSRGGMAVPPPGVLKIKQEPDNGHMPQPSKVPYSLRQSASAASSSLTDQQQQQQQQQLPPQPLQAEHPPAAKRHKHEGGLGDEEEEEEDDGVEWEDDEAQVKKEGGDNGNGNGDGEEEDDDLEGVEFEDDDEDEQQGAEAKPSSSAAAPATDKAATKSLKKAAVKEDALAAEGGVSDLDDPELSDEEQKRPEPTCDDLIIAQVEQVTRPSRKAGSSSGKWKVKAKFGIAQIGNEEVLFNSLTGEFKW